MAGGDRLRIDRHLSARLRPGSRRPLLPSPPEIRDPVVTDVLSSLPDCVFRDPGSDIDLEAGCVGDACAGDTFEELDEILGGGAECEGVGALIECVWDGVLAGRFEADGDDPVPDAETEELRILTGYAGSTPEGLGVGITPRCFVEVLEMPDRIVFEDVGGTLTISEARWDGVGLLALDQLDADGDDHADGVMDQLRLSGAPPGRRAP